MLHAHGGDVDHRTARETQRLDFLLALKGVPPEDTTSTADDDALERQLADQSEEIQELTDRVTTFQREKGYADQETERLRDDVSALKAESARQATARESDGIGVGDVLGSAALAVVVNQLAQHPNAAPGPTPNPTTSPNAPSKPLFDLGSLDAMLYEGAKAQNREGAGVRWPRPKHRSSVGLGDRQPTAAEDDTNAKSEQDPKRTSS